MGIMKFELFKNIIDQLVLGGTRAMTMASRGEPLMHPQFNKMLDYASGKFLDFKINTNATYLDEKMCHVILSSGINVLTFSIDAHEKKLYEEIRVKGNFDDVLSNIIRFEKIRKKHYPGSKISTRVSGVMFRKDQDVDAFQKFWGKIVDLVVIVAIENRWDTYNLPIDEEYKKPCDYLWDRLHIWFDGKCNPCDVDYKSNLSPGTVCDNSILEIWKSEALQRLRQAHIEESRSSFQPCDRCGVS